jgi:hypothetical protein
MKPYFAFLSARQQEFTPTAQAVVASFPDPMPDWLKVCIMILVDHNIKFGNWGRIRCLQLGYLNTTANSMKDLKGIQNGTPVAAPTFTAYNGYVTDGLTNHINRGIVLSTNGGVLTQTDAWVGEHLLENLDTGVASVLFGAFGSAANRRISLSQNPTTPPNQGLLWRIIQGTAANYVSERYLYDDGIYFMKRTPVSPAGELYHDNVLLQTSALAVGLLPDVAIYSGALNENGVTSNFGKFRLGTFACGAQAGFNFAEFVASLRTFRHNVLTYSVL